VKLDPPARSAGAARRLVDSRLGLWSAFVVVHAFVIALALVASNGRLGDVGSVYEPLARHLEHGSVPGIHSPWVYPLLALVPIAIPLAFGAAGYITGWLMLVVLLDAAAFAALVIRGERRSVRSAWWWLGFTLLLGPIAVSRLDTLSVPLVILGLLWLATRPRTATVLLTVATWIKVWPAALLVALVVTTRHRLSILITAALASASVVGVAFALGAGRNVFSFITEQADRGLQVEAPVSTMWMWQAAAGVRGSAVVYDRALNTFQVTGQGVHLAGQFMTPLLAVAAVAIVLLGIRVLRAGAAAAHVMPPLALALVAAMVVFNKVASPQYMVWFAAPVVIGLVDRGRGFRVPAILVAAAAALTQGFYPYLYKALLEVNPVVLALLTMRNAVLVAVFGWSLWSLWSLAKATNRRSEEPDSSTLATGVELT
jgi:Protein of unknown function (DUF2029).